MVPVKVEGRRFLAGASLAGEWRAGYADARNRIAVMDRCSPGVAHADGTALPVGVTAQVGDALGGEEKVRVGVHWLLQGVPVD